MSKKRTQNQRNTRQIFGIAAIVAIIGVVAAVVLIAGNTPAEGVTLISPQEYQSSFATDDYFLLDVRTVEEFSDGHIAGATNISVQTLSNRLSEVPTDMPIVLYCRSGNRSAQASHILAEAGYSEIYDIAGGTNAWSSAALPLVR